MHLPAAMSNGWRVEFHLELWGVGAKIYKENQRRGYGWVTLPGKRPLRLGAALRRAQRVCTQTK